MAGQITLQGIIDWSAGFVRPVSVRRQHKRRSQEWLRTVFSYGALCRIGTCTAGYALLTDLCRVRTIPLIHAVNRRSLPIVLPA